MFETMLRELTLLMSQAHGWLKQMNMSMGWALDDKQLHFAVMAALAAPLFLMVHAVFKRLAKWSITAVSFIYVFTVMTVFAFAIEIGQKISGTGNMDFGDVVAGLYGVLAFFGVYTAYRLVVFLLARIFGRGKRRRDGR